MNSTEIANLSITGTFAVTVGGFLVARAWRVTGRVRRFLDDYEGAPARPGVDARPGVMERLQTVEQSVQGLGDVLGETRAIVHELRPNGGASARDEIRTIYRHVVGQEPPVVPHALPAPPPVLPDGGAQ